MIIALEGVDGCGKSSVINVLKSKLGDKIVWTHEPYIKPDSLSTMTPHAKLGFFQRDHKKHWEDVIKPALDNGMIVVSDRYLTSHIVYQARELYLNDLMMFNLGIVPKRPEIDTYIKMMHDIYPKSHYNEMDIYLNVSTQTLAKRCERKKN